MLLLNRNVFLNCIRWIEYCALCHLQWSNPPSSNCCIYKCVKKWLATISIQTLLNRQSVSIQNSSLCKFYSTNQMQREAWQDENIQWDCTWYFLDGIERKKRDWWSFFLFIFEFKNGEPQSNLAIPNTNPMGALELVVLFTWHHLSSCWAICFLRNVLLRLFDLVAWS